MSAMFYHIDTGAYPEVLSKCAWPGCQQKRWVKQMDVGANTKKRTLAANAWHNERVAETLLSTSPYPAYGTQDTKRRSRDGRVACAPEDVGISFRVLACVLFICVYNGPAGLEVEGNGVQLKLMSSTTIHCIQPNGTQTHIPRPVKYPIHNLYLKCDTRRRTAKSTAPDV